MWSHYFIFYKCIYWKKIYLLFELILKQFISDFSHKCAFQGGKSMQHRVINVLKSTYHQLEKWKVKVLVTQSCPTLCDLMDVAHQAPLSMEFSRQEYWSGFPFPSPGDFPDQGIEQSSPALQADSLPSESSGKPLSAAYQAAEWLTMGS